MFAAMSIAPAFILPYWYKQLYIDKYASPTPWCIFCDFEDLSIGIFVSKSSALVIIHTAYKGTSKTSGRTGLDCLLNRIFFSTLSQRHYKNTQTVDSRPNPIRNKSVNQILWLFIVMFVCSLFYKLMGIVLHHDQHLLKNDELLPTVIFKSALESYCNVIPLALSIQQNRINYD